MYKLSIVVTGEDGEGEGVVRYTDAWFNFRNHVKRVCKWPQNIEATLETMRIELEKLNGAKPSPYYIEFDTEEDATVFKLKFS